MAPDPYVDLVVTGGDGSSSLNLASASRFSRRVRLGPWVKHGNRPSSIASGGRRARGTRLGSFRSRSASRRVPAALRGFNVPVRAPHNHPAMKPHRAVRRLSACSLCSHLGSAREPAAPPFHVIGAFGDEIAAVMAETATLAGLPLTLVRVHDPHGVGLCTPAGPFVCYYVRPGRVERSVRESRVTAGIAPVRRTSCAAPDARTTAPRLKAAPRGWRHAGSPQRAHRARSRASRSRFTGLFAPDQRRCATGPAPVLRVVAPLGSSKASRRSARNTFHDVSRANGRGALHAFRASSRRREDYAALERRARARRYHRRHSRARLRLRDRGDELRSLGAGGLAAKTFTRAHSSRATSSCAAAVSLLTDPTEFKG